jgi:hypothetical protein
VVVGSFCSHEHQQRHNDAGKKMYSVQTMKRKVVSIPLLRFLVNRKHKLRIQKTLLAGFIIKVFQFIKADATAGCSAGKIILVSWHN